MDVNVDVNDRQENIPFASDSITDSSCYSGLAESMRNCVSNNSSLFRASANKKLVGGKVMESCASFGRACVTPVELHIFCL